MGEKIIKVTDNFRTNPESLIPGGHVVEIFNTEGLRLVYDKIKNPQAYIARITKDPAIKQVYVDGELKFERTEGE
jgi:predicted secreted protein